MEFLKQLLAESKEEKKKKGIKSKAADVYHRDYMKTRNKPYRKYDAQERSKDE